MRAYKLTPALKADLQKLYTKIEEMTPVEQRLCEGIIEWVLAADVATYPQLQVLGRLFKRYHQDGEYVHHNWQIWKNKRQTA